MSKTPLSQGKIIPLAGNVSQHDTLPQATNESCVPEFVVCPHSRRQSQSLALVPAPRFPQLNSSPDLRHYDAEKKSQKYPDDAIVGQDTRCFSGFSTIILGAALLV
jgi:hypothetical protein